MEKRESFIIKGFGGDPIDEVRSEKYSNLSIWVKDNITKDGHTIPSPLNLYNFECVSLIIKYV